MSSAGRLRPAKNLSYSGLDSAPLLVSFLEAISSSYWMNLNLTIEVVELLLRWQAEIFRVKEANDIYSLLQFLLMVDVLHFPELPM